MPRFDRTLRLKCNKGEPRFAFGWVAVPGFVLRPVTAQINSLFNGMQFTDVKNGQIGTEPAWQVDGVGR